MTSLAKLYGLRCFKSPEQLANVCCADFHRFDEQNWRAALSSLIKLSPHVSRSEVRSAEKKISAKLISSFDNSFSNYSLAYIAWCYGKLGIAQQPILTLCKSALEKRGVESASTDDLTKIAWSATLLQDWDKPLLVKISAAIEQKIKSGTRLRDDECFRLRPVSLVGRVVWNEELLGARTVKSVRKAMSNMQTFKSPGSHFQKEVAWCVQQCRSDWKLENEYQVEGYYLDIAFPSKKIGIEADGVLHFYPGSDEIIARDLLREKILQKLGWKIVHITWDDWQKAPSWKMKIELIDARLASL